MSPRSLVALALAAALTVAAVPPPSERVPDHVRPGRPVAPPPAPAPEDDAPLPDLDEIDPVRFGEDETIVEHAQVTTRGGIDQMWVDIIRPDTDEPVPTILIASPYYNTLGRGWRGELKNAHQGPQNPTQPVAQLLGGGSSFVDFPEWYDEYFVARGYAVALMDLRGSRNSSGCQVYGDRAEVLDTVDVIDWIADQGWSNGKVGMTGGSYDGTIAIGAAVEQPMSGRHPDALAAIIPLRAISRWYDYHFFNGVQSQGHALTPALFTAVIAGLDTQTSGTDDVLLPLHLAERKACIPTFGMLVNTGYASPYQDARAPFWRQRDFTRSAPGIRAATFIVSGLFDFNVKNHNTSYLWDALPDHLPRKLWWMNGGHGDPHTPEGARSNTMPFPFQDRFVEATHRWYAQYLKGLEAGAHATPTVETQRADGSWDADEVWPAAGEDLVLGFGPDGTLSASDRDGVVAFSDGPTGSAPASHVVVTAPFTQATRLSGQIAFDLEATISGPDATVAVDVRAVPPGVDPSASATAVHDGATDRPLQATYGWVRAYYRDSVPARGLSTPTGGSSLTPGETVRLRFGALPTDLVVPEGWSLALRFASSAGGTLASQVGGDVELRTPSDGGIRIPVAPS
ncbi:CocE/NonD family hydrolase [Nitriliruptor alkaliphilus]|uniref:CocE/NonD family hydrolase n=1 Tax=Nitriliruptor alkaliphilus TaxID=427918 RepID=UPI000A62C0D3|nr:CocE/NonD family hydrolase [Nitriliruptor alkaliphilus]